MRKITESCEVCQDIRVIIVKLADRLHNMRTLGALREEKQRRIASETLDIYAPLADRLGISTIKWELEDLALSYLDPEKYYMIASQMNMKRDERIQYVQEAVTEITQAIQDLELENVSVYGRPKHIYSIYRKMTDKHKAFEEIYDLSAVRVSLIRFQIHMRSLVRFIPSGCHYLVASKIILRYPKPMGIKVCIPQ